jgi:4-amino-4-deoxy-L-arabinose transferase-like glycosyltransferase
LSLHLNTISRPLYPRINRSLLLLWLLALLALSGAPILVYLFAGETTVTVGRQSDSVWAEIHGTYLEIRNEQWDLHQAASLSLPGFEDLTVEPPSSSRYWQPTQNGIFSFIGTFGEWLQNIRPPAHWVSARVVDGEQSVYTLLGGRAISDVPLDNGSGTRSGLVLRVQPEAANFEWWTLVNGHPGEELVGGSYRPSGTTTVGDILAELAMIAWSASLLCIIAYLAGFGLSRLSRRRQPATSTLTVEPTDPLAPPTSSRWLDHIRQPRYVALALFVAGTVLSSIVALVILDGIPHVVDEVAYIFQGKIFAHLRSTVPQPLKPEFFQSSFVMTYDGRWFSKYPPGYPLMLVPALWAGVPWLVNALSCGVSLALIYMAGLRMFGRSVALWAGLLGVTSPWILFMSGSYMSHPTTMLWAALFLYALVCLRQAGEQDTTREGLFPTRRAALWGLTAGFAIGMAFITREWTALGIGLGAALWAVGDILSTPTKLRRLLCYALVVVGFLPPLLFLLYQNVQLTGDPLRLAQDLVGSYDTPGFGPGHGSELGHTPAMGLYNGLVYLRALATIFGGWPAPFALVPIVLGLVAWIGNTARRFLGWDALLWLSLGGLLVAYFFWWSSTTIYGPRYWYEGMPFMLLMAGRGMDLIGRIVSRALSGVWPTRVRWFAPGLFFVLFSLYSLTQTLPALATQYHDYNDISVEAIDQANAAHLKNALLFVALEPTRTNRDYGKVFFANDPLMGGDVIYVRDLGKAANTDLLNSYPGRAPYYLPLQGPPVAGVGP